MVAYRKALGITGCNDGNVYDLSSLQIPTKIFGARSEPLPFCLQVDCSKIHGSPRPYKYGNRPWRQAPLACLGPRELTVHFYSFHNHGDSRMTPILGSKVSSPSPIGVAEFYDVFSRFWIRFSGLEVPVRKKPRIGKSFAPCFSVEASECL